MARAYLSLRPHDPPIIETSYSQGQHLRRMAPNGPVVQFFGPWGHVNDAPLALNHIAGAARLRRCLHTI